MRPGSFETYGIDPFILTLKDQATESPNPHRGGAVLYLKCWGSDYPYLPGVEPQKRWLPVVVHPAPGL